MTPKERLKLANSKAELARGIARAGGDKFLAGLDDYSKEFFDLLKKEVASLSTEKGLIKKNNPQNKKLLTKLQSNILLNLRKTGYYTAIEKLLDNFTQISQNTKQAAEIANDIKIAESLLTDAQTARRDAAIDKLLGQGLNANFVNPIVEVVNTAIVTGGDLQSLITELEQVLITNANPNKQALGLLSSYATRVGRDVLFQMQGTINQVIRTEYNLDGYAYIGTEVDDTRPQCSRWLDKGFLKIDELEKEIEWAYKNGKGMIEGTTPDTFAIDRGGYNCRHAAIPMQSEIYYKTQKES